MSRWTSKTAPFKSRPSSTGFGSRIEAAARLDTNMTEELRVSRAEAGQQGPGRDEVEASHPAVCQIASCGGSARGVSHVRDPCQREHVLSMPVMGVSEPYESGDYVHA